MSLNSGTRLGPYEVTGSLGVGGMGEAYRARDTRLKRDVALKIFVAFAVLPEVRIRDSNRMAVSPLRSIPAAREGSCRDSAFALSAGSSHRGRLFP